MKLLKTIIEHEYELRFKDGEHEYGWKHVDRGGWSCGYGDGHGVSWGNGYGDGFGEGNVKFHGKGYNLDEKG